MNQISIRGARQHNLCNLDLKIPHHALIVVTGLSGSGKSSLAFDTLYAEGQRRYIESLSTYARQFLDQMEKPDVDTIEGLSPSISIEQKSTARSPRSTVGTITEVYDYLRLLFSSVGQAHCPRCGKPISKQSVDDMVERVLSLPENARATILAPVVRERKGEFRKLFEKYLREGYLRARVDGELIYLEDPPSLDRRRNHSIEIVVDRLLNSRELAGRIEESVRQAIRMSGGLVLIAPVGGEDVLLSERMACVECAIDVPTLEPRSFSFNSRFGACPKCAGLGVRQQLSLDRLIRNPASSLGHLKLALEEKDFEYLFEASVSALLKHFRISEDLSCSEWPGHLKQAICNGIADPVEFRYGDYTYKTKFRGLAKWFEERIRSTTSTKRKQHLKAFMTEADCPACGGSRLRPESRSVRINRLAISDYCRMPLADCLDALDRIRLTSRQALVASPVLDEIRHRIGFLVGVGLEYLSLDRQAQTLSAGEAQRVRLATQIGTQLRGVLYVLDEPSIGLHPRDTRRLLKALKNLRDLGNTVVVVEHDEDTIRAADHVVDLGPGAGEMGGKIVAQGNLDTLMESADSLTGAYLKGTKRIPGGRASHEGNGKSIDLLGVTHHNLKNVNIGFPLGKLITVTGVSGAGKSSLVDEVLYRALSRHLYSSLLEPGPVREIRGLSYIDKVIEIDQSPIGRTPRSNPATYCGVFTPIRELFALLPEAKMRGYRPGRFSFNVKGGRCEVCSGEGMRKVAMNFLPDVYVLCESCRGSRYNRETLSVKYKGYSIADILDLSVESSFALLENIPPIKTKLRTLLEVGLGYITLGQSSTTLSGGEAQRVKLARELSRKTTGRTLYILDEPTTGLHFEDVKNLLNILHELVSLGNTVVVIEHNLDVIRSSDWIIDLGPEGGIRGGEVVAEGTPLEVSQISSSYTGQALALTLARLERAEGLESQVMC